MFKLLLCAVVNAASLDPGRLNDSNSLLSRLEAVAHSDNRTEEEKRFLIDYARLAVKLRGADALTEEDEQIEAADIEDWINLEVNKSDEPQEEQALSNAVAK